MKSTISLKWKRHCIYCGSSTTKNKEHILPKHVGYIWPIGITCRNCNSILGGEVDKCWNDDYWILLKEGRVVFNENKYDSFVIKNVDGVDKLIEPFTSPGTWRPVTKIAFECLSFINPRQHF